MKKRHLRISYVVRKSKKQIGKSNRKIDKRYRAMAPGKRVSRSGKVYYERRRNRSDANGNIFRFSW